MSDKIVSLEVENIQRIRAVAIRFDGRSMQIGGKNGQGKTSLLDSLEMAIGGARSISQKPVRDGAKMARIVVKTERLIARRVFDENGDSELVVTPIDSSRPFKSPQTMLTELCPSIRDPLEFMRMEPAKQKALAQKVLGLDFSALDDQRAELYEQRAQAGRDVTGRKNQLEAMPVWADAPAEEVAPQLTEAALVNVPPAKEAVLADASDLLKKLTDAQEHNREKLTLVRARDEAGGKSRESIATIVVIRQQIKDLQSRLAALEIDDAALLAATASAQTAVDAFVEVDCKPLQQAVADIEANNRAALAEVKKANEREALAVKARNDQAIAAARTANQKTIADAEAVNRRVRDNQAHADQAARFAECKAEYDRLTGEIEEIDTAKAKQLAAAKFPVPGLGFGLSGILYNGIPFEQASSAEQLRVSTAMALALCPDRPDAIKVLLPRDGSLLDEDSLRMMFEMCRAADAQLLIERVGSENNGLPMVIISDGTVLEMKGV